MIKTVRYNESVKDSLFFRGSIPDSVEDTVKKIIADVRENGDSALFEYCRRFDKVELTSFAVTEEEIKEAFEEADGEFLDVLRLAAENITAFHENQKRSGFVITRENGAVMGQKVIPIENVALYVPGGTAAYPSTVLMSAIPAKIAGCKNIYMVTPPGRDGRVAAGILAAAKIAGVDRIFKLGGAQAVAALAYGTESIPKVDKIVGPGNAYVAQAKRQVYGEVSIDMIAGPSEIMIIADKKSDPAVVAADLLSQAEHDRMATAVLATDSEELAAAVSEEIEKQLPLLLRQDIARASVDNNGKIIITESLDEAVAVANLLAPEHLEICVDDPFNYLGKIDHAGSVFLGRNCPEALGDYLAGPNHTLPTSGTARFSSPLSVDDFVKKTQFTYFTAEALDEVAEKVKLFADTEGLTGHGRSAVIRKERKDR